MIIINNEMPIFVDVDDTLIIWGKAKKGQSVLAITSPYDGTVSHLRPHLGHIKILKDRKLRGSIIVVWSAGGYKWAEAVVKALNLENYVDFVMSKPLAYIDDKHSEDFMGEHIYLGPNSTYGT